MLVLDGELTFTHYNHSSLLYSTSYLCRSGNKSELFSDLAGFPVLRERREQIENVFSEVQEHLKEIRKILKTPTLDYKTVSGQEVFCVCVFVGTF